MEMTSHGISSERADNETTNLVDSQIVTDIESLREAKRRAEEKLKRLKLVHEEELRRFDEVRIDNILRNNGMRDYIEKSREKQKVQEEMIKNLKEELHSKKKQIEELTERNKMVEKQANTYMQAWKNSQIGKEANDTHTRTKREREFRGPDDNRKQPSIDHNSATSLVDAIVPPPPLTDEPSMEEILGTPYTQVESNSYASLEIDIPPPPPVDDLLEEILGDQTIDRAFEREQGQFICHAYAAIDSASCQDTISEIVNCVLENQNHPDYAKYIPHSWSASVNLDDFEETNPRNSPHITLIRGHRAIYYHHISPVVDKIRDLCSAQKPFSVYLDRMEIFYNHEMTKQFLCLAVRHNQPPSQLVDLKDLKGKIREVIDQFATRLTEEDESTDTLAHCSLFSRDINVPQSEDQLQSELESIDSMLSEFLGEYPSCLAKVEAINLKIGNHPYRFQLSG